MKRRLTAVALLAALSFGSALPSQAFAASPAGAARSAAPVEASVQVDQVQYRDRHRHWHGGGRHWDNRRHRERRHYRPRPPRSGIYFHFGTQPRYAPPPRYRPRYSARLPVAHYRWCENRYRSYRASDNSFQPYHGPRRACISPYI